MLKSREYPRRAFYLGAVGLATQLLAATAIYLVRSQAWPIMGVLMGSRGMAAAYITMGHSGENAFVLSLSLTLMLLSATLFSLMLLKTGKLGTVKIGAVLLIILALMSVTTTFGLILGSALMIASGIAGIVWTYQRSTHL